MTGGSIVAVVFASLIISIVQFQARLSEARTQNGNITLESIQLVKDHQEMVTQQYKEMRKLADRLGHLRATYTAQFNSTLQRVASLCEMLTSSDSAKSFDCVTQLHKLINSSRAQIDYVVEQYRPEKPGPGVEQFIKVETDELKKIIADGVLLRAHTQYTSAREAIEAGCQNLLLYVSDRMGAATLLAVSPELQKTVQVQCYFGSVGLPTYTNVAAPPGQKNEQGTSVPAPVPAPDFSQGNLQTEQNRTDVRGVNRILLSELVFYYRFYSWLTSFLGATGHEIVLAPPEFIIILLVIATGILGSFLFHTYTMFLADDPTRFPSFFAIFLRGTLSVMCALVIFILARTGFVAITEGGQRAGEAMISPFVIAFVSVAAGLLAERAIERIRGAGISALAGQVRKNAGGKGT